MSHIWQIPKLKQQIIVLRQIIWYFCLFPTLSLYQGYGEAVLVFKWCFCYSFIPFYTCAMVVPHNTLLRTLCFHYTLPWYHTSKQAYYHFNAAFVIRLSRQTLVAGGCVSLWPQITILFASAPTDTNHCCCNICWYLTIFINFCYNIVCLLWNDTSHCCCNICWYLTICIHFCWNIVCLLWNDSKHCCCNVCWYVFTFVTT